MLICLWRLLISMRGREGGSLVRGVVVLLRFTFIGVPSCIQNRKGMPQIGYMQKVYQQRPSNPL